MVALIDEKGEGVEAFESFVALALEDEGFVVSEAVKFPLRRRTRRASYAEVQQHFREVDLVGARRDRLVLATVKSFLGSRGVVAEEVMGTHHKRTGNAKYAMLNEPEVRDAILLGASERYGYPENLIEFRLYAGRFAGSSRGEHERAIRDWCASQNIGVGPIGVFDVTAVADVARRLAQSTTYRNNPALVAIKVLEAAGQLVPPGSD